MAEETAVSAPEETIPAPEVAGAENANESPANGDGGGVNNPENNGQNADATADAAGGDSHNQQQQHPAPNAPAPEEAAAAAAAHDAAAGGVGGEVPPPIPALSADIATYFANLQTAILRQASSDGNSATGGSGSSGGMRLMTLLWEGVAPITAVGNAVFGSSRNGGIHLGFESNTNNVASDASSRGGPMNSNQAALYLYAVAQNIVGLEAAVLGSRNSSQMFAAGGGGMPGGALDVPPSMNGGGISAKQVAEIVSAVSIAATFCSSRSLIAQSGILAALAHLIESTGTITTAPTAAPSKKSKPGPALHALTPFHAEFFQCCLLACHYRYASNFLALRPTSHMSCDFPYCRLDPTSYLRTHYYAGLVHVGCNDWNAALDSFHLCLTMPCSSVSAISVAARKKSLLVQCLLLESEELDGTTGGNDSSKPGSDSQARDKSSKSRLENKVLDLPGAASAAVNKHMAASSNRVGGGGGPSGPSSSAGSGSGSAPERTAGSETSEQPSGRERQGSSRRRMRSANSNSSSDAAGGERGGGGPSTEGRSSKTSHLGSYHDLVSTYITGNASHYAKLLTEMTELLHVDGNWGLAKQLEGRLAYRAVRKVASIYSVVGEGVLENKMQEVSSALSGSGASGEVVGKRGLEDLLIGMAATDAKDALLSDPFVVKIDQSTGMVSFLDYDEDNESSDDDSCMDVDLSQRLQSCIALAERVRDLDITLTTSPKYQSAVMKEMMMKGDSRASAMMKQQGGGASVADIGHSMDIGVDW